MHDFFKVFAAEMNGDQVKRATDPEQVPVTKTDFYRWIVDAIWTPLQTKLAGKARSATATMGGGLLTGGTATVNLTWATALPTTSYNVVAQATSGSLVYVGTSARTTTGCTVTMKNAGLSAIVTGGVAVEFTIIPY